MKTFFCDDNKSTTKQSEGFLLHVDNCDDWIFDLVYIDFYFTIS